MLDGVYSKEELAQKIFQASYLRGEFKLRSGAVSDEYFDKYRFESQPQLLASIAHHLKPLIPSGVEAFAGLEMGGIPIATALSLQTGIPVAFVRKTAKDYGTCQVAEGLNLKEKRVLIIEDVITTGGQVILSAQDLRQLGAQVVGALCVILRGSTDKLKAAKIDLTPLFTMDDLKGR